MMMKENEIRRCSNRNCQKPLPEGYSHFYCEACRNKHTETAKKILTGVGAVAAVALGLFFAGGSKGDSDFLK